MKIDHEKHVKHIRSIVEMERFKKLNERNVIEVFDALHNVNWLIYHKHDVKIILQEA